MFVINSTRFLTKPYRHICDGAIDRWIYSPQQRGIEDSKAIADRQQKMFKAAFRISIALSTSPAFIYAASLGGYIGGFGYLFLAAATVAPFSLPAALCGLGGYCTTQACFLPIQAIASLAIQKIAYSFLLASLYFAFGYGFMNSHDFKSFGILEPKMLEYAQKGADIFTKRIEEDRELSWKIHPPKMREVSDFVILIPHKVVSAVSSFFRM